MVGERGLDRAARRGDDAGLVRAREHLLEQGALLAVALGSLRVDELTDVLLDGVEHRLLLVDAQLDFDLARLELEGEFLGLGLRGLQLL